MKKINSVLYEVQEEKMELSLPTVFAYHFKGLPMLWKYLKLFF